MNIIHFKNQKEFMEFLEKNNQSEEGIWIKFDKKNTLHKLTSDQALKSSLAYGWIDGQIKSLDDEFYLKYFTKRRPKSNWSERNKKIAEDLIRNDLMKTPGLIEIQKAKKDGRWESKEAIFTNDDLVNFTQLIKPHIKAYHNYLNMSPSIQKTYAKSYFYLKTNEAKENRLSKIIKRLEDNLKPM